MLQYFFNIINNQTYFFNFIRSTAFNIFCKYEGYWKNFLKHGNGIDRFVNGDTYKGQYWMGKPHGKGVYIWKNGSIYKGEFYEGVKQGKGEWIKKTKEGEHIYKGNLKLYRSRTIF